MYKIKTNIELPIAHCLSDAYSGLCVGNVYRDKKSDGSNDRYDLKGGKVLQIVHGHSYKVTVELSTDRLNETGMVVDFKLFKKILKGYFEQYDHSMILKEGNSLLKYYKNNPKVHTWPENPTAEYMSKYWSEILKDLFIKNKIGFENLDVTVEETSHNSVTFSSTSLL